MDTFKDMKQHTNKLDSISFCCDIYKHTCYQLRLKFQFQIWKYFDIYFDLYKHFVLDFF